MNIFDVIIIIIIVICIIMALRYMRHHEGCASGCAGCQKQCHNPNLYEEYKKDHQDELS